MKIEDIFPNNSVITGADKTRSYNGDYMKRAKEAEKIVIEYLKMNNDVIGITDWREKSEAQTGDIDILITNRDGTVTLAEIKSDSHLGISDNVLFESLRINHTCSHEHAVKLGWSAKTPAQYILYYALSVEKLYRIKTEHLRYACQQYTKVARNRTNILIVPTDQIKTTICILIPMRYCADYFTIYDLSELALIKGD